MEQCPEWKRQVCEIYPFNLAYAIYLDYNKACNISVEGIDMMLDKVNQLNSRARDILISIYRDDMTLKSVGEFYGITGTRVAQLQHSILRKIRRSNDFMATIKAVPKIKLDNAIEEIAALQNTIKRVSIIGDRDVDIVKIEEDELRANVLKKDFSSLTIKPSLRLNNCMRRKGIHILADFLQYDIRDIYRIRNMGLKTLEELFIILKEYDVKLKPITDPRLVGWENCGKVCELYRSITGWEPIELKEESEQNETD